MAKELQGTVKEILGTCFSVGCTVDGKDPKDLQQEMVVVVSEMSTAVVMVVLGLVVWL
ncbi:putative ribosomal protein L11/L12 [Helianthus anomalus]